MAPKGQYKRKRRAKFSRYKRYGRRTRKTWNVVKDYVMPTLGFLKGMINTESKAINSGLINTAPSTTATITYLTGVAQGDDYTARNGRSVRYKSLFCRGWYAINASSTQTVVRTIIFIDKFNQGSAPAASDLLQDPSPPCRFFYGC